MSIHTMPRGTFFKSVFGPFATGYLCIVTIQSGARGAKERYFHWPKEFDEALEYIDKVADVEDTNVYYCPQLFDSTTYKRPEDGKGPRVKENIKACVNVWADLDTCEPDSLLVKPTVITESSPGRYQAVWLLDEPVEPTIAEALARRIAYHHIPDGADKSGWDLTQLLRVPYTHNYKYASAPMITFTTNRSKHRDVDFGPYPEVSRRTGGGIPMPEQAEVPDIPEPMEFLQNNRKRLNSEVFRLFTDTPDTDSWSESLWKLMLYLFEGGFDREHVYAVSLQAACNKYARDGKSVRHLWDDVCRAYIKHMEDMKAIVVPELEHVDLLTKAEEERVRSRYTFVERYIAWATSLGDAAPQYHQAGAFVVLSGIMAGRVNLPTSFGTLVPNLWFMILADTTLTRKSTAMDIGVDLLVEVDPNVVMATDGSLEGLLQGLATRPGQPSIFLRDEFTGMIESMTKKDYMAGMMEMFTKLYDGKLQKRILRKDVIEIKDPVLILFTGGIRNRMQQLLNFDHISSGFMPRFIFLTAESDVKKVKPLGPPIERDLTGRDQLLDELRGMYYHYTQKVEVKVEGGGVSLKPPRKWKAKLTPEAWQRFNIFEDQLLQAALKSDMPDLMTPIYARLGISTLKAAVLIAASETRDDDVIVTDLDIIHAISFAARWREFAIDIINGVGMSQSERELQRILGSIQKKPGINRSQLMQAHHLNARNADLVFQTLEQRGLITRTQYGKGSNYYPVGSASE